MERWVGKIAVVTGASAGIGKDVAKQFVEKGLQVVAMARRLDRLEELAKSLGGKPGKLYPLKCDVSVEEEIKKCFQWIKQNIGPVSILVNNAGIAINTSYLEGETKLWKQMLDTNMFGLAVCTVEAVKQMKEANIDGHIININSIVGHKILEMNDNTYSSSMYSSTKHGVTAFTEVMRNELRNAGTKIRITSISPGVVNTEIFSAGNFVHVTKENIHEIPHLLPEDITEAIMYALSAKPHVQVHEIIIKPVGERF